MHVDVPLHVAGLWLSTERLYSSHVCLQATALWTACKHMLSTCTLNVTLDTAPCMPCMHSLNRRRPAHWRAAGLHIITH